MRCLRIVGSQFFATANEDLQKCILNCNFFLLAVQQYRVLLFQQLLPVPWSRELQSCMTTPNVFLKILEDSFEKLFFLEEVIFNKLWQKHLINICQVIILYYYQKKEKLTLVKCIGLQNFFIRFSSFALFRSYFEKVRKHSWVMGNQRKIKSRMRLKQVEMS